MFANNNKTKFKKCHLFFQLNVILEVCAIGAVIYCTLFSNCVLGNEIGGPVYIFSLFIFAACLLDLLYLLLSPKLHTLGVDPLGVMFNFIIGGFCILIGFGLISVLIFYCGYYAQFILAIAGVFSVCSGIIHWMNAFMCHKILPKSERYYKQYHRPKGTNPQKVDETNEKEFEKPQKTSKRSEEKYAEKVREKGEAQRTKKDKQLATHRQTPKKLRIISKLLYFTCFALECIGFLCLLLYTFTLCVLGRENSTRIWWSLNCIFPPILPDIVFAFSGFFIVSHLYAPIAAVYNIVMASLCILSGIVAFASITGCGNPAQSLAVVVGIIGLVAGALHMTIARLVLKNLEGGGKLFAKKCLNN